MTLFVADIASYQAGLVPAALRPDCAALIVKCTQGSTYVDPQYAAWLDEARHAGLLVGAYHYVDNSPPMAQAVNLKTNIIDPSLVVMLDEEQAGLAQTLAVADAMKGLGLHVRLLYLARSYWSALGSPDLAGPLGRRGISLVNAAYPSAAAARPVQLYPGDSAAQWGAYGGVTPALWQFTEAATEAGQRIDVSAYRGTLAGLTDLFTTSAAPAVAHVTQEDDMPEPVKPLSVYSAGEYMYDVPDGRASLRLTADGNQGGPAVLRLAFFDAAGGVMSTIGDSPASPPVQVGGRAKKTVGHLLPAGCTGVGITRKDPGGFSVAVGFHA